MQSDSGQFLSASEAATRLGVKLDTIYAYVSRGLLTRHGTDKQSRFAVAEVERLAVRGRRGVVPKPPALVIASALTEVTPDAVRYRGRSALELARSEPFEHVAEWLWSVPLEAAQPFVANRAAVVLARSVSAALPEDAAPLERLRVIASVLGSTDPLRYDTSTGPVVATGRALIAGMVESLPRVAGAAVSRAQAGAPATTRGHGHGHGTAGAHAHPEPLAQRLFSQLTASRPTAARVRVLDAAMGLCADHALSPSTLAVRIAAGQRADPYGVVQTGLGALSGALHGAASWSAEELIAEVEAGADPLAVIGARLRRGERIPGFGHTLHQQADPRAPVLLELVREHFESKKAVAAADAVAEVMHSRGLPAPNIDWALAVFVRAAEMVHGASEAIMAISRIAGWIAHALEEYAEPTKFPWSALYVGPRG